MKKTAPAANPDAYVAALTDWRRACVEELQMEVSHSLVRAKGPVLLIRAEDERVLLGYWRGKRLREIEPRLVPGGKYEMATAELREGDVIAPTVVRRLTEEALRLDGELGDPTAAAPTRK